MGKSRELSKGFTNNEVNEIIGAIEGVPSGVISLWSGSIATIPEGWNLCDGTNGTPNLSDTFIYGTATEAEVGTTGGSANAVNVAHTHSGSTNTTGNHSHTYLQSGSNTGGVGTHSDGGSVYGTVKTTSVAGTHSHTVTIDSSGESGVGKNLPPYMKLAYIQKA